MDRITIENNEEFLRQRSTEVDFNEYDHLDGILHIDKTDNVMEMTIDEMKVYRSEHPYEILAINNEMKKIL